MEHANRPSITPNELPNFLAWVNQSDHVEAANAAADLHAAVVQGVLPALDVWAAVFQDDDEADQLLFDSRCFTALLGNSVVAWVQAIRAELPALVEGFSRRERDDA